MGVIGVVVVDVGVGGVGVVGVGVGGVGGVGVGSDIDFEGDGGGGGVGVFIGVGAMIFFIRTHDENMAMAATLTRNNVSAMVAFCSFSSGHARQIDARSGL